MKTNQLMKRSFNGASVTQRTKDSYFNATDLLKYYNEHNKKKKVIAEFWSNKNTKEYMEALTDELNTNVGNTLYLPNDLYSSTRGKDGGTYMHPYLFVKFAMWLSPKFEVQIMKWIYDNLIDFRNLAGDHYKEMCGVIAKKYREATNFKADPMVYIREARYLNLLVFGDEKGKQRNEATPQELDLLNKLQIANMRLIQKGVKGDERRENLRLFATLSRPAEIE